MKIYKLFANIKKWIFTWFQKYKIDIFLFILLIIAISSIIIIQFDITSFKFKCNLCQETVNKWNEIWLEFSYGYISGYILFLLTVTLPHFLNYRNIKKGIHIKIEAIGNTLNSILKCFAENTGLPTTDFDKENIKKIFSKKNWNDKDSEYKLLGINKTCIQACDLHNRYLLNEIDSLINTYKEYLDAKSISKLEGIRKSQFIKNISIYSFYSLIDIQNLSAKEGLAEEFSKIIDLYNEIKELV